MNKFKVGISDKFLNRLRVISAVLKIDKGLAITRAVTILYYYCKACQTNELNGNKDVVKLFIVNGNKKQQLIVK